MESFGVGRFNMFSRENRNTVLVQENRSPTAQADIEAQTEQMAERSPPSRLQNRFSRSAIPSFMSSLSFQRRRPPLRPTSSHYSADDEVVSPKSPDFVLDIPNMPSTRLHLPHLLRTGTHDSNGPPTRPATAHAPGREAGRPSTSPTRVYDTPALSDTSEVIEPHPAVWADHVRTSTRVQQTRTRQGTRRQARDMNGTAPLFAALALGRWQHRHRSGGGNTSQPSGPTRDGDRHANTSDGGRRKRKRRMREQDRQREGIPLPKNFLFCFPWVKSRRIRSQILRCFVSGLFLTLMLTIYLALSISKNINNSEFTVMLILIILGVTIFFCHSLVRLCILIVKGPPRRGGDEDGHARSQAALPQMYGPGGYAIPREPIRVTLARDEEAAGIESEATKINPPAYGLWRQSVRVDPNRIYWMRNEDAPTTSEEEEVAPIRSRSSSSQAGTSIYDRSDDVVSSGQPRTRRPPSYVSDDGVEYVVEAQPRSIAPTFDAHLMPHPTEAGRLGRPSDW